MLHSINYLVLAGLAGVDMRAGSMGKASMWEVRVCLGDKLECGTFVDVEFLSADVLNVASVPSRVELSTTLASAAG